MKSKNPYPPFNPTVEELEQELKRVRTHRNVARALRNTILSLAAIAAVAVAAALFLPVLRVQGESMEPTLNRGDFVIALHWADCAPGDVASFVCRDRIMIKRVIARGGDVVDILEDGTVEVNGAALEESYVTEAARGALDVELPVVVPDGQYFVMGDNRADSVDSRNSEIGCVPESQMRGRVIMRIWPLDQLCWFSSQGGED